MTVDERSPLLLFKDAASIPDHGGDHDTDREHPTYPDTLSVVIALIGG